MKARLDPSLWKASPPKRVRHRALAPAIERGAALGVTLTSPQYQHLTNEAVSRFRAITGLDVVILWSEQEPAFAAKLNLDLLLAPVPIVFFDVDLWMLRPFDFLPLLASGKFGAVHDPGAFDPGAFPHEDCAREGWERAEYFNSGLFTCDLGRAEIRAVFAMARARLADCHAGRVPPPEDYGEQYFLNWAVQQQPGLLQLLPAELNFYKAAFDHGFIEQLPREIIGLHAAACPVSRKLAKLQREAAVFGEPVKSLRE